jgi:hypothetical protein
MNVVDFAYQILEMQGEIVDLRRQVARLQKIEAEYWQLHNESREHGEKMMGNLLAFCLTPGIPEALAKHAEAK